MADQEKIRQLVAMARKSKGGSNKVSVAELRRVSGTRFGRVSEPTPLLRPTEEGHEEGRHCTVSPYQRMYTAFILPLHCFS